MPLESAISSFNLHTLLNDSKWHLSWNYSPDLWILSLSTVCLNNDHLVKFNACVNFYLRFCSLRILCLIPFLSSKYCMLTTAPCVLNCLILHKHYGSILDSQVCLSSKLLQLYITLINQHYSMFSFSILTELHWEIHHMSLTVSSLRRNPSSRLHFDHLLLWAERILPFWITTSSNTVLWSETSQLVLGGGELFLTPLSCWIIACFCFSLIPIFWRKVFFLVLL